MDAFKTHGAFSWSELMTSEPDGALRFYAALLGWHVQTMAMPGGDYHVLKVGDESVGGIMAMPADAKAAGTSANWGCYVTVTDVDATARRATELGGQVMDSPKDIPGVGRMAVIVDPQGATLNLITYLAPSG